MDAAQQIDDIIARETEAFIERVTKVVRPIVDTEFRKALKRCPKLKRVLFGNGTWVFDFGTARMVDGIRNNERVPRSLQQLTDVCNAVSAVDLGTAYFIDDDLVAPAPEAKPTPLGSGITPKRKATKKVAGKRGRKEAS